MDNVAPLMETIAFGRRRPWREGFVAIARAVENAPPGSVSAPGFASSSHPSGARPGPVLEFGPCAAQAAAPTKTNEQENPMNLIHEFALLFAVATPLVVLFAMNLFLLLEGERGTLILPTSD